MISADGQGPIYHPDILASIGGTPLVRLNRITRGLAPMMLAKVESFNPGGSVKDRIGLKIIDAAERAGDLEPGGTIIEATAGNTGCGLAMVAAVRGYHAIFTVPDKISQEKINLLKAYGAEVHVTPTGVPPDHPDSFLEVAKQLAEERPGALLANQYFNPANPESHRLTTGPEIWTQTAGQIDFFVAGIGTGGTISGVGRSLKQQNPEVQIVGVDPAGSVLAHYCRTRKLTQPRSYKTEGVGRDMIPGTIDFDIIDRIITVGDSEGLNMARRLSREEGLLCGGSSGMAMFAALDVARELSDQHLVVVLLPDTGERYLSKMHSDEWMRDNRLLDTHQVRVREVLMAKSGGIPPLLTVKESDPIGAAVGLIKRHNISQLPVQRVGRLVGCVEEGTLMSRVLEDPASLSAAVVEAMGKPLPTIEGGQSVGEAIRLLADRNAVVVMEDGDPRGILTRFDLIEYVSV